MKEINPTVIKKLVFSTDLQIRIYYINYGNHLGHDSLVSLIHEARVRFFKLHGFTELSVDGDVGIVLTKLTVNYKAEAFYADNIQIDVFIGEVSKVGLDFYYVVKIKETGKEIANSITTAVFFDYKQAQLAKIPPVFLDMINRLNAE